MRLRKSLPILLACLLGTTAFADEPATLFRSDAWQAIPEADHIRVEELAAEYKTFLGRSRHELMTVAETVDRARASGFTRLADTARLQPGDRVFVVNRDRGLLLAVMGEKGLPEGATLVAAHIDSPRLELKGNPLYESEGFALFQTSYHGGIKTYQWSNVPLALVGRVTKPDGISIDLRFGLDGGPVLVIPDLAPHVDKPYRERTQQEVLAPEELDPVVGSRKSGEETVRDAVAAILREDLGLDAEDFVSAQLALVPALDPADVGFDGALIGGYGQDDLLCAYPALQALFELKTPSRTALVYLAANEEVGSHNVYGAGSPFLADTLLEMLARELGREPTLREHRRAVSEIHAISADVTTGVHPTFGSVQEVTNAARLGGGVVLKLYGRGNNPVSEVLAKVRRIVSKGGIPWQTHMYKVGIGGGGTLGRYLSDDGMDTVDIGLALLSAHSPWSLSSKADLWWAYRFFTIFFQLP